MLNIFDIKIHLNVKNEQAQKKVSLMLRVNIQHLNELEVVSNKKETRNLLKLRSEGERFLKREQ